MNDEKNIYADQTALEKAIDDAIRYGTGVVKFQMIDGFLNFDHVPAKDFSSFGDELKFVSTTIRNEKTQ